DRAMVFSGDTMPTAQHVGAAYNMGYDLLPLENRESKHDLLARAADERQLIVIDHECATPVVSITRDGNYFALVPADR
ncbi:MAG: hypothetical protein JXO22_06540, partial [Phycisphaerae bacterium]|nr:hypothetical protein [Phycisphaerae bacterium]